MKGAITAGEPTRVYIWNRGPSLEHGFWNLIALCTPPHPHALELSMRLSTSRSARAHTAPHERMEGAGATAGVTTGAKASLVGCR